MATKTAPTAAQLAFAEIVAGYQKMTVAQLRKLAAGKVSGASKLNKAALLDALVLHEDKAAKAQDQADRFDEIKESAALNAATASKVAIAKSEAAAKAKPSPKRPVRPARDLAPKAKLSDAIRNAETASNLKAAKAKASGQKATRGEDGKIKGQMCAVCGNRRKDNKTQGRDSTMCRPCYDYAGWENTHADEGHEGIGDGSTTVRNTKAIKAIRLTMKACPVCAGNDPAKTAPKSRAAKKAPTPPNNAKPVDGIDHPKAAKFAGAAKEAGWKVGSFGTAKGISTLVVTARGGEYIEISWDGPRCLNTGTMHKGTDGKLRHVRNASAARKILEG